MRGTLIEIGARTVIDAFVKIKPAGGMGDVVIGPRVNSGTVIYTGNGVRIGDGWRSPPTAPSPPPTTRSDRTRPIREQGFQPSGAASSSRTTAGSAPTACCWTAR